MSAPAEKSDEYVQMFETKCDSGCGRVIGWTDNEGVRTTVIICTHCMNNPDEVEKRLGI